MSGRNHDHALTSYICYSSILVPATVAAGAATSARVASKKPPYSHIEFRHGYGLHRPRFRRRLLRAELVGSIHRTYSNGLLVEGKNMIVLRLGWV